MKRRKLREPRALRDELNATAAKLGTSQAALLRGALIEYGSTPPNVDGSEIVGCQVFVDDPTWDAAEARAAAEGLTLSMALRPLLAERIAAARD